MTNSSISQPSVVIEIPPAESSEALRHFSTGFHFETDCWDVHASMTSGQADFVLLDARSPDAFARAHIPGAFNVPHRKIIAGYMDARWPKETIFVAYCAGPHCNGAQRAAVQLAKLGRPVKLMVGGITGWLDEGFLLANGPVSTP